MVEDTFDPLAESDADSEAFTQDRIEAAKQHLRDSQELAKENFTVLGEDEPNIDRNPKERDVSLMTEKEKAALETQNEIASDNYEPKSEEEFKSEVMDSPDINPDAKEFQRTEPDEFTGPEAADEASRTGVNPRSAATASDREGMLQAADPDLMAPVSENAEPVAKPDAPSPETPNVLDN